MLIRDFPSCLEDVSDIKQITEKRRYIIIFKYDTPVHMGYNYTYDNMCGNYDIYLINESTIHGDDFMIPYGITLFNRNQYRGIIRNPFLENGEINNSAEVMFYHGSYSNRVHKTDGDVFKLSSPTIIEGGMGPGASTIEDELMRMLNSDWIQPYPEFYNIEDQAVFSTRHKSTFVGDFLYDYNDVPTYTLGRLIDQYTKVAVVEMPNINNLINLAFADTFAEEGHLVSNPDPIVKYNNGVSIALEDFKRSISYCFIKINQYVMDSVFSQVDVIINTEDGTFNVVNETIRLKFRELSKKDIVNEMTVLIYRIGELVDRWFGVENISNIPTEVYKENLFPDRVTFHISNVGCKIKVSNTKKYIIDSKGAKVPIFSKSESSASDTDEMVAIECSDLSKLVY